MSSNDSEHRHSSVSVTSTSDDTFSTSTSNGTEYSNETHSSRSRGYSSGNPYNSKKKRTVKKYLRLLKQMVASQSFPGQHVSTIGAVKYIIDNIQKNKESPGNQEIFGIKSMSNNLSSQRQPDDNTILPVTNDAERPKDNIETDVAVDYTDIKDDIPTPKPVTSTEVATKDRFSRRYAQLNYNDKITRFLQSQPSSYRHLSKS